MISRYNFIFSFETKVIFGIGSSKNIGEEVKKFGLRRVLLVVDKKIRDLGLLKDILSSLNAYKIKYYVFENMKINPHDINVYEGLDIFKNNKCDFIVAIGGGSTIDMAKAVSVLALNNREIYDYETTEFKDGLERSDLLSDAIPIIAIPTTIASGSETSPWCVITDTRNKRNFKMAIGSPAIYPRVALIDPELTATLPNELIVEGTMDGLAHAIEAYTSLSANSFSDAFALQAIKLIVKNLKIVLNSNININSRANLSLATILGGMAATSGNCNITHAIAEAVGGVFDTIPHGLACGIVLPYGLEYNFPACKEKYIDISKEFGFSQLDNENIDENANIFIKELKDFLKSLGLKKLNNFIIKKPNNSKIEKIAVNTMNNECVAANPVKMKKDNIVKLLERLFSEQFS